VRTCKSDVAGDWQGLDSPTQTPRYAAIADMLRNLNADAFILDIGCGEAILKTWLSSNSKYVGVEASSLAARRAAERHPDVTIVHSTAESYDPGAKRFSGIVFNEVLYYAADPVALLRKYSNVLRPNGAVVCSIYQHPGRPSFRRRLVSLFDNRRPKSNIHCFEMVRAFMVRDKWIILDEREVRAPDGQQDWKVWAATPRWQVAAGGIE
jgi:2-polyprenyl-3-methyl-5-hydroxy-6-metoxy-1,4-benzoquinol methylase